MSKEKKLVISDCDHTDINEEKKVFEGAGFDYSWFHCQTEEEVIEKCHGAVAMLNQCVPLNEKVFKGIPTLKMIVRYGVGVDNVDIQAATKYNIQVCNVPDYGTEEVADQAFTLMMALSRKLCKIVPLVKEGIWDYTRTIPIQRNRLKTVGIVGLGRIGSAFAKRVHVLGCRVIGYDPYANAAKKHNKEIDFVEFVSKEELLQQSDIISLHCSLNKETEDIIGEKELKMMKPSAYLINVARGGLIDEAALDKALTGKWIAGAGIDVTKTEPLPADSPLLKQPELLITPHMAWYSEEAAVDLTRKCAEEAVRFLKGEKVHYPVNKIE
ncbi:MAG: C-terminal binding protein [Selenomonadaceae bacterium]